MPGPGESVWKYFARAQHRVPREYVLDVTVKEKAYAVTLHLPHDLPTARLFLLDITERQQAEAAFGKPAPGGVFLELLEKSSQRSGAGPGRGISSISTRPIIRCWATAKKNSQPHFIPKFTTPAWLEHEEAQLPNAAPASHSAIERSTWHGNRPARTSGVLSPLALQ